uniref:Uncharacterized protein n=1 Tax=Candidatus Kentrum sp. LPFa TaxID=2126335 RepID=A0A450WDB9_9GAMM|nr:MAG: hypothetical protein BECKLPF1236B_GA0070989_107117 [Candidatus Kentron sp. LPFa]
MDKQTLSELDAQFRRANDKRLIPKDLLKRLVEDNYDHETFAKHMRRFQEERQCGPSKDSVIT